MCMGRWGLSCLNARPFANKEFGERMLAAVFDIRVDAKREYALIMRDDLAGSNRGRALNGIWSGFAGPEAARKSAPNAYAEYIFATHALD